MSEKKDDKKNVTDITDILQQRKFDAHGCVVEEMPLFDAFRAIKKQTREKLMSEPRNVGLLISEAQSFVEMLRVYILDIMCKFCQQGDDKEALLPNADKIFSRIEDIIVLWELRKKIPQYMPDYESAMDAFGNHPLIQQFLKSRADYIKDHPTGERFPAGVITRVIKEICPEPTEIYDHFPFDET